MYKFGIFLD